MKYFAIFSAVSLALVSGYFSVYGLVHIFAASPIPVIIMGTVLEVGKVATALFIHRHWKQLGAAMKAFLLSCAVVLAVLTSTGIFAFLAKNSQGMAVQLGTQQSQVDYIQERLDSLESLKKEKQEQLKSLDSLVGIYTSQSNFRNARQATTVHARQSAERKQLQADIRSFDEERLKLISERLDASNTMRQTEVDVGPAVFVAQAIYGKKDLDTVESAIHIIIFMIIFAFDPLAICLMLAIQRVYHVEDEQDTVETKVILPATVEPGESLESPVFVPTPIEAISVDVPELKNESAAFPPAQTFNALPEEDTFPEVVEEAISSTDDPREQKIKDMLERYQKAKEQRAKK